MMEFLRDVDARKLRKGWEDGFKKNYRNIDSIKDAIETFNASMTDVKKGQKIILDFIGNRVDFQYSSARKIQIEGQEFQRALLSVWLGPEPPNEDLKRRLLGQ